MVTLIVFATGVALSLSVFNLTRGMAGFTPAFDRRTLDKIGFAPALFVFCCAGPVLVMQVLAHGAACSVVRSVANAFALVTLMLLWSCALGVVAVESARSLL